MLRTRSLKTKHLASLVESLPLGIIVLDPDDLRIRYINRNGKRALEGSGLLADKDAKDILTSPIETLDEEGRVRDLYTGGRDTLGQHVRIGANGATLEPTLGILKDDAGHPLAPMLTWPLQDREAGESEDLPPLLHMLEQIPVNVMAIDISTFTITYANATSIKTLEKLEHLLPCKARDIVGQCIDIFHKTPSHQRNILSDPSNLPHRATITLGPETLELRVSALFDSAGTYDGAMLTWNVITDRERLSHTFEEDIGSVVAEVGSASKTLQSTAISLADMVEDAQTQASTVQQATQHLSASVQEISRHISRSTELTTQAVDKANHSNTMIQGLAEAAQKIGDVVNLINDIASQTNLLALNATIEAARAGEAGKGFAVVASEVKNLATQTAKATEEISAQIGGIQSATHEAVEAIEAIGGTIRELSEIGTTLADAVDEQRKTGEEVAHHITAIGSTSEKTGDAADQVLEQSSALSEQSTRLEEKVETFLSQMRDDSPTSEPSLPPDTETTETVQHEAPPRQEPSHAPETSPTPAEITPADESLNRGPFSIEQINAVRTSFALLETHSEALAERFYPCLFEISPDLEALFGTDHHQQAQRLLAMLKSIVAHLDRVDTLLPEVETLGRNHGEYGVSPTDYDAFKEALMTSFEAVLGAQFTPEARDAWETVYDTVASTMKYAQN